ncbi:MAG: indolepyruvate ferredoxin oxidoreductase [Treponema sp.]|nr:indolepyruvate ferredoxin oxidoreductase [Treponema sp.]
MSDEKSMQALLGDEAVAAGALHAGLSAAYGYPGTPSTEILEYLLEVYRKRREKGEAKPGNFSAHWCSNEKTALEAALGVSFAGRRSIVTMKHVGLNVAGDPFINGALLGIKGGLVLAVADDPGMHSSQGEQDSRYYAAFAMIPCLEPRTQQEAYDMTREAFEISERFHVPVMLRLVTRLSHARSQVRFQREREANPLSRITDKTEWMLLPAFARRNYARLIEKQKEIAEWAQAHPVNKTEPAAGAAGSPSERGKKDLVVITSGLGGNYYEENLADLAASRGGSPPRLHIGAYPLPVESIRRLCEGAVTALVIEEGQPFIEERLRGILPQSIAIAGKLGDGKGGPGLAPRTGELDPDNVRKALGLLPRPGILSVMETGALPPSLPNRPPQLCQGCPHGDSYETIRKAMAGFDPALSAVTSDIGCYSLGAMPPYEVPESIVCMGASIGMAKGAVDSGLKYVTAVIGDSTFIHSGITALIDAAAANAAMTVAILDNSIVAMTGCQNTMVPSDKLEALIRGLGLDGDHLVVLEAKKQLVEENAKLLRKEIEYPGLSVVIFRRECLEAARKRAKAKKSVREIL